MQTVPEMYLDKRVPIVTNMVNVVLTSSGKVPLSDLQCEALMSLCVLKCRQYTQRKCDPNAFDKELLSLTGKTGVGYACFLAPPTAHCVNVHCEGRQLTTYVAPTISDGFHSHLT